MFKGRLTAGNEPASDVLLIFSVIVIDDFHPVADTVLFGNAGHRMMLIGAEHECIPGFRRYSVSSSKVTDMEPLATIPSSS